MNRAEQYDKLLKDRNENLESLREEVTKNTQLCLQKRKVLQELEEKKISLNAELEVTLRSIGDETHTIRTTNSVVAEKTRTILGIENELAEATREHKIEESVSDMPDFYTALTEQLIVVQKEYSQFELELKDPQVFATEVLDTINNNRDFGQYGLLCRDAKNRYDEILKGIAVKKVDGVKLRAMDYIPINELLHRYLKIEAVTNRWS